MDDGQIWRKLDVQGFNDHISALFGHIGPVVGLPYTVLDDETRSVEQWSVSGIAISIR